jgi:hypothetical protein
MGVSCRFCDRAARLPPSTPKRMSSRKKHSPSNSAPANGLASQSQASQTLQLLTKSQSPQQTQQSQPLYPWSAYTLPSGRWPLPLPRYYHTLSTTATAAGELFLFGGATPGSISCQVVLCNDLYVISTRDISTTFLKTSGSVPNPRYGHRAVLTNSTLFISGGEMYSSGKDAQNQSNDDSFYLLDLGTSDILCQGPLQLIRVSCAPASRKWFRIVINGPGPCARSYHTMTLIGSKLFVFGGESAKGFLNDIWALDLNHCMLVPRFREDFDQIFQQHNQICFGSHMNLHPETRSHFRGLVMSR